uniref:U14-Liphistoxin-Lth1a_1 n=1 Tax=Liphistius thaleban TaxID=1905330 RepID=A0A4V2H8X8_9ARAC
MLNKAIGFVNELLLSLSVLVNVAQCSLSAEDCLQLGMRRTDLHCNWCEKLAQFDLDVLNESCLQCCGVSAAKDPVKKYPQARLEVCG